MKQNFVDCFMVLNTALSLNGGKKLSEMGRPTIQEFYPTVVNVSLSVQVVKFIDIKNVQVQVNMLLHQRWMDTRLAANARTRKIAVAGQIWKPKITNVNGITSNYQNNLEDTTFWRGFGSNGNILLSEKWMLTTFCTADLKRFPFDTQYCQFKFGTYRFPMEEVELVWDHNPAEWLVGTDLEEFILIGVSTSVVVDTRPSGNFTILLLQLTVKRYCWHYVFCSGIPSILTVCLCYLTFWIDKEHGGIRYILNIFCLSILLHNYYLSLCHLQAVPYMKASDIFVSLCISFVIISFMATFLIDTLCNGSDRQIKGTFKMGYPKSVMWIELFMRIAFPVFYLFFILVFCLMYVD